MQPLSDMAFDHAITSQTKNIISQLLHRLQLPNLVGTHMRIKWYHCYMPRDLLYVIYYILYVIHSATSTKTITANLGGNTYQNEMVVYLHVM